MKAINYIRLISLCIFVVPIVVINLCLFVSINYEIFENTIFTVDQIGRSGFSIPYIDGSLSISRAARTYPQYLLFKPGMIITAVLLILYWIKNNELFKEISNNSLKKNKYFLFFGVGSALFLISHSVLLGLNYENDLYKFFRRFVLLGFIIFEIAAQALLVLSIIQLKENLKICDKGDKLLLIYDIKLNTEDLIVNLCSLKDIIISKEEINIIHKRGSGLSIICTYDPN